jgi:hypothetical protein
MTLTSNSFRIFVAGTAMTCGIDATALLVDTGARNKLIALQKDPVQKRVGLVTFP